MSYSGRPDFQIAPRFAELTLDERTFAINDEQDVARCLRDYDAQVLAHEFLLPETELQQMALESARAIILQRNERRRQRVANQESPAFLAAS